MDSNNPGALCFIILRIVNLAVVFLDQTILFELSLNLNVQRKTNENEKVIPYRKVSLAGKKTHELELKNKCKLSSTVMI